MKYYISKGYVFRQSHISYESDLQFNSHTDCVIKFEYMKNDLAKNEYIEIYTTDNNDTIEILDYYECESL